MPVRRGLEVQYRTSVHTTNQPPTTTHLTYEYKGNITSSFIFISSYTIMTPPIRCHYDGKFDLKVQHPSQIPH